MICFVLSSDETITSLLIVLRLFIFFDKICIGVNVNVLLPVFDILVRFVFSIGYISLFKLIVVVREFIIVRRRHCPVEISSLFVFFEKEFIC